MKLKVELFLSGSCWDGKLQNQSTPLALFPEEITSPSLAIEDNSYSASFFDFFFSCAKKKIIYYA